MTYRSLFRFAAGTAVAFALGGCADPLCTNDIRAQYPSPDGRFVATVIERGCGATTGQVGIVSLREQAAALDPERREDWVFAAEGQDALAVRWRGGDVLEIRYGAGPEPVLRQARWNGVAVEFQAH